MLRSDITLGHREQNFRNAYVLTLSRQSKQKHFFQKSKSFGSDLFTYAHLYSIPPLSAKVPSDGTVSPSPALLRQPG